MLIYFQIKMSDRRSDSVSTLEIIMEVGHKAILKDVPVQVQITKIMLEL